MERRGPGPFRGAGAARSGAGLEAACAVLCLPDIQAVYKFPGPVWHLEVLARRGALYVLCAQRGIYCLSLDQASR